MSMNLTLNFRVICFIFNIHAEVVTRVAGSLEAGGMPGYPESKINVMKS